MAGERTVRRLLRQPIQCYGFGCFPEHAGQHAACKPGQIEGAILLGTGPGQSWFDPLAFAPVTTAAFGTAGFNTLRGPGTVNLDASLFRDFRVTERIRLQFRFLTFNTTNTPRFSNPSANVSNMLLNGDGSIRSLGGYTTITSTKGTGRDGLDQRVLQFAMHLNFLTAAAALPSLRRDRPYLFFRKARFRVIESWLVRLRHPANVFGSVTRRRLVIEVHSTMAYVLRKAELA